MSVRVSSAWKFVLKKANQVHKDSFSLALPYAKWNVHEITALLYVCPSQSNSASNKHYGLWLMKSGIKKIVMQLSLM